MKRSKGSRSKARHKMRRSVREKGTRHVSKIIQQFNLGDKVHIILDPSIQKGQPHPRFQGRTGLVLGIRGKSCIVKITDGNSTKVVISAPAHLRLQEGPK